MRLRKLLCAMTASAVLLGGTFPAAAYEGTQMQTQVTESIQENYRDDGILMKKKMNFDYYGKYENNIYSNQKLLTCVKLKGNSTNLKAVSSDHSIVSVEKVETGDSYSCNIYIKMKKPGKTVLKVQVTENGKTKTVDTSEITVRKYSNPVKSLKVGNREYASKLNKLPSANLYNVKTGTYKISCTAAKGWKVKEITYAVRKNTSDYGSIEYRKLKNNGTVKLNKKDMKDFYVELYNPTLKITSIVSLLSPEVYDILKKD
ncbi:hypothetical protein DWX83_09475 [Ruminococcus sp. AF21-42]|nr:hypothetical protein DWX83_09475 [Ruminococcus sp. AF21-42]